MTPKQAAQAAASIAKTTVGIGLLPPEDTAARLEVCSTCDYLSKTKRRCKMCGCVLKMKARDSRQNCPLKKWPTPSASDV